MGREREKREIHHQSHKIPEIPCQSEPALQPCPSRAAAGWGKELISVISAGREIRDVLEKGKIRQQRKKRFLQRGRGDICLSGTSRSKGNKMGWEVKDERRREGRLQRADPANSSALYFS